jgi:LmbE family N-acetylglucosaminyl deacetylase
MGEVLHALMPELGTILGVWAHPDDETYLSGGLMAEAVRAGRRVVCVVATRGGAGTPDPEAWPPERLTPLRTTELENAMGALGVDEIAWLDYIDGECDTVPDDKAVDKLTAILAEVEPDTVLTFGPDAMTGHPDHVAVSRWTTAAFEAAAKPGARLLYATMTKEWAETFTPIFEPYNVFGPEGPPMTPPEELVVDFELSDELLVQKLAAIRAHDSQSAPLVGALGEETVRATQRNEYFRLGAQA